MLVLSMIRSHKHPELLVREVKYRSEATDLSRNWGFKFILTRRDAWGTHCSDSRSMSVGTMMTRHRCSIRESFQYCTLYRDDGKCLAAQRARRDLLMVEA